LLTAVTVVILALGFFIMWAMSLLDSVDMLSPWFIAIGSLIIFALWNGYFLFFEATRNGQTPGKKSIGIRVIRDSGHPVDFRSALLRNIMRTIDMLPGSYGVGFVSVFVSSQYRRLGDYVGGTLVVRMQHKGYMPPMHLSQGAAPESQQQAGTADPWLPVETLPYLHEITREDYRTVRHFLDRRRQLQENIAKAMAAKISGPLAKKLRIEPETINDHILFLECLSREWERRMIH
jgi:uncharacterized RDD family membrane protein YckC